MIASLPPIASHQPSSSASWVQNIELLMCSIVASMVLYIFSIVLSSGDVDAFVNPPTNKCPLFPDNTHSAACTDDTCCPRHHIHRSCSFTSLAAVFGPPLENKFDRWCQCRFLSIVSQNKEECN
ncbi:hypothetical protein PR202_ga29877 [Eleusine coracana subsp. coracana]|uniref:Uncharacterized protein n=1 Tax=Eleusine coracana subsp. coracana TaxID=191504 RepID=A0AAV5DN94_ELECO|nr:hypothetical protein PR202_ga29877 [Eleusine coracana subsp. coracana]